MIMLLTAMVEAEERTLLGGTIIGENNNDEVRSMLSTDCCGDAIIASVGSG
jgi:hypothetical protein